MRDKTYIKFDDYYHELAAFLQENKGLPTRETNRQLYYWMVRMRIERKAGRLEEGYVKMLDSLGFIWDMQEYKWQQNYAKVKELLLQNIIPGNDSHPYLYYWMNKHLYLTKLHQLPAKKVDQIEEMAVLIRKAREKAIVNPDLQPRGKQNRWNIKYEQLVEFKKKNPGKWPKMNANDPEEKKLASWCVFVRNYYNKGVLPNGWYEKLSAIGFDFLKKENIWMKQFELIRDYIAQNHALPHSYNKLYNWSVIQYKRFDMLGEGKQALLNGIRFKEYFEARSIRPALTWDEWYEKLKEVLRQQNRLPVLRKENSLFHWLKEQQQKLRANKLSETAAAKLRALGIG